MSEPFQGSVVNIWEVKTLLEALEEGQLSPELLHLQIPQLCMGGRSRICQEAGTGLGHEWGDTRDKLSPPCLQPALQMGKTFGVASLHAGQVAMLGIQTDMFSFVSLTCSTC